MRKVCKGQRIPHLRGVRNGHWRLRCPMSHSQRAAQGGGAFPRPVSLWGSHAGWSCPHVGGGSTHSPCSFSAQSAQGVPDSCSCSVPWGSRRLSPPASWPHLRKQPGVWRIALDISGVLCCQPESSWTDVQAGLSGRGWEVSAPLALQSLATISSLQPSQGSPGQVHSRTAF